MLGKKEFVTVPEWREIKTFPGYSVSNVGTVRNDDTGRLMARSANQYGVVSVGLVRRGVQYKRSVALLVADAFLEARPHESFITPINLNGDRFNNRVDNLLWRPRWFAVKYAWQFRLPPAGLRCPIEEFSTEEIFPNSWDAAIRFGLLDAEILTATLTRSSVWPTRQRFRIVDE